MGQCELQPGGGGAGVGVQGWGCRGGGAGVGVQGWGWGVGDNTDTGTSVSYNKVAVLLLPTSITSLTYASTWGWECVCGGGDTVVAIRLCREIRSN
jgi:hypothetical protein